MVLGLEEVILPLGIFLVFLVLFGKNAILKLYKDFSSLKKEIKQIDTETNKQ